LAASARARSSTRAPARCRADRWAGSSPGSCPMARPATAGTICSATTRTDGRYPMFDVIVIGAGGGGPVVAKELAQRGLSVLLLEGGARHADPRSEWTHFENDANNPLTGFLRFGPADRTKPAWFRELPQNSFLFQVSGVGGTTQHYFGNCPRAYPGPLAA